MALLMVQVEAYRYNHPVTVIKNISAGKMTLNLYQKTAVTTVIATLVLIFVGGLVRASGAGLGCPDQCRRPAFPV